MEDNDLHGVGTILVVDDEETVLRVSSAILKRHGYQVITAATAALALEIVREKQDELALVILDLTMPVMGGEEVLTFIKASAPALPVLLSSGCEEADVINRVDTNAIAGFIYKPFSVASFLQAVKEMKRQV